MVGSALFMVTIVFAVFDVLLKAVRRSLILCSEQETIVAVSCMSYNPPLQRTD